MIISQTVQERGLILLTNKQTQRDTDKQTSLKTFHFATLTLT